MEHSDIIFVPIQTPHEYKYEGCTRLPKERDDFNYDALKTGITMLSDEINKQLEHKIVIIISTVLPGTIDREILPIVSENKKFHLCYNPFFIAMGTTIQDFENPEFVLFGTEEDWVGSSVKSFYSTIHKKPFHQTSIKNAELIKVAYNTFIGMKIVFSNTMMEICHKIGANVDDVMSALKLANDRLISPKYLGGGMGDGGGCVKPEFKIKVNNEVIEIKDLYNNFNSDENLYLVESANYSCTSKQNKKIFDVTKRNYVGKIYTVKTKSGKKITLTPDHIVPVDRDNKRILIKVSDIKIGDYLYIL